MNIEVITLQYLSLDEKMTKSLLPDPNPEDSVDWFQSSQRVAYCNRAEASIARGRFTSRVCSPASDEEDEKNAKAREQKDTDSNWYNQIRGRGSSLSPWDENAGRIRKARGHRKQGGTGRNDGWRERKKRKHSRGIPPLSEPKYHRRPQRKDAAGRTSLDCQPPPFFSFSFTSDGFIM